MKVTVIVSHALPARKMTGEMHTKFEKIAVTCMQTYHLGNRPPGLGWYKL